MYNLQTTAPAPANLGELTEFKGVVISLPALIEAASAKGVPIEGRTFLDCVIVGPAILTPGTDTRFKDCNFGDVDGNPRNLFVAPAGDQVIGALSVWGCVFDGCLFNGVGLAGDQGFISAFLDTVTTTKD